MVVVMLSLKKRDRLSLDLPPTFGNYGARSKSSGEGKSDGARNVARAFASKLLLLSLDIQVGSTTTTEASTITK